MAAPHLVKKDATYDDLKQVPEHLIAEIIAGSLYTSPRPGAPHARAASVLGADLLGPFDRDLKGGDGPGGWFFLDEPELHLVRDILVPDIAGWRRERMPVMPRVPAIELAPDWVCEIISPSSIHHDRIRKMDAYLRHRVQHYWIVDPQARTLEVFEFEAGRWVLASFHSRRDKVRARPFDAVELDLSRWWLPGEGEDDEEREG